MIHLYYLLYNPIREGLLLTLGFPGGSDCLKSLPAMQEIRVHSLGQDDSPGEGNGYPLQYSCLENCMDRGAMESRRVGHD